MSHEPAENISLSYHGDFRDLAIAVDEYGKFVLSQLQHAFTLWNDYDKESAQQIKDGDDKVNQWEIDLDSFCHKIIARRQPAATDMRVLVATLKIITDYERIGDETKKMVKNIERLNREEMVYMEKQINAGNFFQCIDLCVQMFADVLDAYISLDEEKSVKIIHDEAKLDKRFKEEIKNYLEHAEAGQVDSKQLLRLVFALKSIERIGDHLTNIAEHVIFIISGNDVRHTDLGKDKAERVENIASLAS